jgi:hypothetical protein
MGHARTFTWKTAIITCSIVAISAGPPVIGMPDSGRPVVVSDAVHLAHAQGAVPEELLGRWNGGSNESGHWYFEFHSDGSYRAWPAYVDNPSVLEGEYSVSGTTLKLSNYGRPISVTWSISAGLLFLDGYSYVRA